MTGTLVQIALGGALGALARFGTQALALRLVGPGFPAGTLAVNVLGSFLMGLAAVWVSTRLGARFQPLVMVGFLGAYTTFSTYALDVLTLWDRGAGGQAVVYALGSVVLSVGACLAGLALARGLLA
jgi:fluoride exporter